MNTKLKEFDIAEYLNSEEENVSKRNSRKKVTLV